MTAAGLPSAATASIRAWDDLLVHGHLPAEPHRYSVARLDGHAYEALVRLAANYFAAGYEFHVPTALRPEEQAMLRARFDRR